jgi:hypothetical protein
VRAADQPRAAVEVRAGKICLNATRNFFISGAMDQLAVVSRPR